MIYVIDAQSQDSLQEALQELEKVVLDRELMPVIMDNSI